MHSSTREQLESTIKHCAKRAEAQGVTALDAMQFTQAAVNAANVLATLDCNEREAKKTSH